MELVGPDGLLNQLTKRVLETALEEEMAEHLGYDKHDPVGRNFGNSRNGVRSKTVLTEIGPVEIDVPRDVDASFQPQIVKKRQRRLTGVDEIVLSLTARGLHGLQDHRQSGRGDERVVQPAARPGAVSSDRCESSLYLLTRPSSHGFCWCSVAEAEPRPVVEFCGDVVELIGGPGVEVGSLGEVLAEQTVGVLVAAALPRGLGVAEVDLHPSRGGEPLVLGHLVAEVPGQRLGQLARPMGGGRLRTVEPIVAWCVEYVDPGSPRRARFRSGPRPGAISRPGPTSLPRHPPGLTGPPSSALPSAVGTRSRCADARSRRRWLGLPRRSR